MNNLKPSTSFVNALSVELGNVGDYQLVLAAMHLAKHVLLLGKSGSGKSKLQESMIVQIHCQGFPFALVDIDGQTADHTAATLVELGQTHNLVYLKPCESQSFRIDPFHNIPNGQALYSCSNEISRTIGRPYAIKDYSVQMQRHRILVDLLVLLGTKVNGKHLGLHRALDILDCGSKAWERITAPYIPLLPEHVRRDWQRLCTMNIRDREYHTNSTFNILHQYFGSSLIRQMHEPSEHVIDFASAIKNRTSLIFNLDGTQNTSKEEMQVIAGMVISGLLNASFHVRLPYYLCIEEISVVGGADVGDWLRRGRKRNMPIIATTQGVHMGDQLKDMAYDLLSQAGVLICFQQRHLEDVSFLAETFRNASPDFELDYRRQQFHDGYEIIETPETTIIVGFDESEVNQINWSQTHSNDLRTSYGTSEEESQTEESSTGKQKSFTKKESEQETDGSQRRSGFSIVGDKETDTFSREYVDTTSRTQGSERQQGLTESHGQKFSQKSGTRTGIEQGDSQSSGFGGGRNKGKTKKSSTATTLRQQMRAKFLDEIHQNGLKNPLDVQLQFWASCLYGLGTAQALALVGNSPVLPLDCHFISDPQPTAAQVSAFLTRIENTPFVFTPSEEEVIEQLPQEKPKGRGAASRLKNPPEESGG